MARPGSGGSLTAGTASTSAKRHARMVPFERPDHHPEPRRARRSPSRATSIDSTTRDARMPRNSAPLPPPTCPPLAVPSTVARTADEARAIATPQGPTKLDCRASKWAIVIRRRELRHADVAQLVEHHLAKVRVAGSNPVVRSEDTVTARFLGIRSTRWSGREARQRPAKPCTRVRIPSPPRRAIGAAVARFPDTEEVTGSIPVSPTNRELTAEALQQQ